MSPNLEKAHAAPRCEHILFDNQRCTQPALQGRRACRFHFGLGDIRAAFPIVEDGLSLQVALNQIARAILDRSLDRKTATTLLYCFQIMSTNLKQMNAERKLSQKKDEDDDLPGPSLAEILLDKLKEIEIDDAEEEEEGEGEEEEQPASTPVSPSSIDNRQSAMPFGPPRPPASPAVKSGVLDKLEACSQSSLDNRQSQMPFGPPRPPASPAVNQGVVDKLHACSQSSLDNRQSQMPFGPPRPPASPAVNQGVVDKLHACAQSSIDNRQSAMPPGPSSLAPPITMSAS